MARKVFYSFHYKQDSWRASQVRNAGVVEGNRPASDNDWEEITDAGAPAIRRWIDRQLAGKSCAVVLIGRSTAGRKWIRYEITEAWNAGKGVLGVHVHNLKDGLGRQTVKGRNPFEDIILDSGKRLSTVVKAYDPPYTTSTYVHAHIRTNLAAWVEKAIEIRKRA